MLSVKFGLINSKSLTMKKKFNSRLAKEMSGPEDKIKRKEKEILRYSKKLSVPHEVKKYVLLSKIQLSFSQSNKHSIEKTD